MRKAVGILAAALVAGIGGYLFWAYPRLPASMPLATSSFGSRETFVGVPAVVSLLLFALFLAAARSHPKTAWLSMVALGLVLFFVHVRVQDVLAAFLPVPGWLALAVAGALVGLGVAGLFYIRPPKPKRVRPF